MQEASEAIEELMERRRTPEARAERERSEHAHEDQGTDEALALARSRFRGAVLAPVWSPLGRPGGDVERFLGDRSALVELPDGDRVAMESVVPLRPKTGSDRDELADLDLQRDGGELVPENPLVPIEISNQRDGGIEFPEAGVSVSVDTPGEAPAPEVVADKAFYANAGKDLDVLVAPTPAGAEVSLQIRSAAAPERVALPFDLPPGARLGLSPASDPKTPSAAEIVKEGKTVGTISAPIAFDAQGVPLEVSYELEGEKLIVVFPHRGQDVHYPALVDPNLSFSDWYRPNANGQVDMWPWTFGQYGGGFGANGANGLQLFTNANWWYAHASAAQWAYQARRASYVVGVDYNNTWHAPSGHYPQGSCVNQGVWSPQRNWFEPGYWSSASGQSGSSPWSGGQGTATNTNACWTLYNDARWHRIYDGQSTYGNIALFKLTMNGAAVRPNPAWAAISDIRVYLDDNNLPQITSNTGAPSSWVGGGVSITQAVGARDPGIGMAALKLTVPQAGGAPLGPVSWAVCTKGRLAGCPETLAASFSYNTSNMPEGVNSVTATPYDATWKTSTQVRQVKVDRTAPDLVLGGSLRDSEGESVQAEGPLQLNTRAVDASPDEGGPETSGVRSVELLVDGANPDPSRLRHDKECPDGSCDYEGAFSLDASTLSPGQHTLTVRAFDYAGNQSDESWTINVAAPTPACSPPEPTTSSPSANIVSADQATSAVSADHPEAVEPSVGATLEDRPVDPRLAASGSDLKTTEGLAATRLDADSGGAPRLRVGTGESAVCVGPVDTTPAATSPEVVAGTSAVFPNTAPAADTIVRPVASGADLLTQVRASGAPEGTGWRIALHDGQRLEALPNGDIAIKQSSGPAEPSEGAVDEAPEPDGEDDPAGQPPEPDGEPVPGESAPPVAPDPAAIPNVVSQIQAAEQAFGSAPQPTEDVDDTIATIRAPAARDADGDSIATSLGVSGDVVTIRVAHQASGVAYPVLAQASVTVGVEAQTDAGVMTSSESAEEPFDAGSDVAAAAAGQQPRCDQGSEYFMRVLYTVPNGVSSRFNVNTRRRLRGLIRRMNARIRADALHTSGGTRAARLRVYCDAQNNIDIRSYRSDTVPSKDQVSKIFASAKKAGFTNPHAKYLIFYDENGKTLSRNSFFCGRGVKIDDRRPGPENRNNLNGGTSDRKNPLAGGYAVVLGRRCWSTRGSLHEYGHVLGAVQNGGSRRPPFSDDEGHCNDGRDVMCDGGGRKRYRVICQKRVFDCRGDTYFDTRTEGNEWLSSRWNLGNPVNRWLSFP